MAPLIFSRAVLAGRPIEVFNHGRMRRDFTYIDDIVAGVLGALDAPMQADAPHRVFNLGNHAPVALERFIEVIESAAGRSAIKVYRPMQPGDMIETMADTSRARAAFGFDPATPTVSQREDALAKRRAAGALSLEGYWDELQWSQARTAKERAYLAAAREQARGAAEVALHPLNRAGGRDRRA